VHASKNTIILFPRRLSTPAHLTKNKLINSFVYPTQQSKVLYVLQIQH